MLLKEIRELNDCDEEFGTLDSSEKTIAILGDRCWPHAANNEGDKTKASMVE